MTMLAMDTKTITLSDETSRNLTIVPNANPEMMESLETIRAIGDLIAKLRERLRVQSLEIKEGALLSKRKEAAAVETIYELEQTVQSQDDRYLKLASVLEAKLVECAELRARHKQTVDELDWMKRHISTVNDEIMNLKKQLGSF